MKDLFREQIKIRDFSLSKDKSGKINNSLLLICERSVWSNLAASFAHDSFAHADIVFWNKGEPYPSWVDGWHGDYVIGFKADLIIKESLLRKVKRAAINIHPAPPLYRGIGGYQHAIYNGDTSFGVTCHYMNKEIDSGKIIKTLEFPIMDYETASSLRTRTGAFCLILLYEIVSDYLYKGRVLPETNKVWGEKLYLRSDLENWMEQVRSKNPNHRCLF